ncbi:MAG: ABC transporter ATP-binding protein [Spirochaetales bacterium]
MEQRPACSVSNATVLFEESRILSEISVTFPGDECTVIMGATGSGKSTLLKLAAGLVVPDSGAIELLGVDPARASDREMERLRANNGFVFQDAALWQNLSLRQNLELPIRFHHPEISDQELNHRLERLTAEVQATKRLDLRPAQVSVGEQKIISFLRAIVTRPQVLFLDEPTSSIDNERVELILRVLRRLKEDGTTLIAVTHDAHLVSQIADRIVILRNGSLLANGSLADVARSGDPQIERVLTDVLSETATYDGDILELLDPDTNPFLT